MRRGVLLIFLFPGLNSGTTEENGALKPSSRNTNSTTHQPCNYWARSSMGLTPTTLCGINLRLLA